MAAKLRVVLLAAIMRALGYRQRSDGYRRVPRTEAEVDNNINDAVRLLLAARQFDALSYLLTYVFSYKENWSMAARHRFRPISES